MKEVRQRTGVGTTTIYKMMNEGSFPPKVSLGAKMSAWLESEVEAWIASRQPEERESWSPPPMPPKKIAGTELPPLIPTNEEPADTRGLSETLFVAATFVRSCHWRRVRRTAWFGRLLASSHRGGDPEPDTRSGMATARNRTFVQVVLGLDRLEAEGDIGCICI
jgi:prophage regulatory protein